MRYIVLVFLLILTANAKTLDVTVSIEPQKFFVNKIAKEKVNVNVMVKSGFSPATYEPKTSQMRKLSSSSIYFSIGVPFENSWLERFRNANKKMIISDTSKGITKLFMEKHSHEHEEHNDEKHDEKHDEHEEHKTHDEKDKSGIKDPHIWLDPILVKQQAINIYETLASFDPKNKSFYKNNLDVFLKELDVLHKDIKNTLKSFKKKEFMVFHPSWAYFAKRYNLEQIAVEKEGKEPKPKEIISLIHEAKEHGIKVIFVSPAFSQESAHTIADNLDGNIVTINPMEYYWADNLKIVANVIKESYE